MMQVTVRNVEQTQALGMSLAPQLRPGDVLLLRGELGAGKTALAQGIARGLGVEGPVSSPTFVLLQCHQGRLPLHHFDLYRLDSGDALEEAGLSEYIGGESVSVIEWPERCESALPARHLDISITYSDDEDTRVITFTPQGGFREMNFT